MEAIKNLDIFSENQLDLYEKIDVRTSADILSGFTFANKRFSMSVSAQINWSNILQVPDQLFPIALSCDNEELYMLELVDKQDFYNASLYGKYVALQEGNAFKQEVKTMTTVEQLNAFRELHNF